MVRHARGVDHWVSGHQGGTVGPSMATLSPSTARLISQLVERAGLCGTVLAAWVRMAPGTAVTARDLTAAANLSVSEEHGTAEILGTLADAGLLRASGSRWYPYPAFQETVAELATAMAAIDLYRAQVHQDATEAQVVLTRPMHSLKLEAQLSDAGWHTVSTEQTAKAFAALIQRASRRVVVMTPFLDEAGADWLKELLEPLPLGLEIVLILRSLEDSNRWDYPKGFPGLRDWLVRRRVRVLNYSIPRAPPPSRETFHAKVILADAAFAYVGSANVTVASREQSMEMGVVVKGQAAAQVAIVVDAVIRSASPWNP